MKTKDKEGVLGVAIAAGYEIKVRNHKFYIHKKEGKKK